MRRHDPIALHFYMRRHIEIQNALAKYKCIFICTYRYVYRAWASKPIYTGLHGYTHTHTHTHKYHIYWQLYPLTQKRHTNKQIWSMFHLRYFAGPTVCTPGVNNHSPQSANSVLLCKPVLLCPPCD